MKLRNIILAILSASFCLQAQAITLDEAKAAYSRGDYAEAAPALKDAAEKEPRNARLNLMAGVALMRSSRPAEAESFLRKAGAEGRPYLAELAFNEYRFQDASIFSTNIVSRQPNRGAEKNAMPSLNPRTNSRPPSVRKPRWVFLCLTEWKKSPLSTQ